METAFEALITSFVENSVGQVDHFLNDDLSRHLREQLMLLFREKQMKVAGVGNNAKLHYDQLVRSDVIYWLDRTHNNPYENIFFDLMDAFVEYLNRTCYTGVTSYEFHYAYYDQGSFYKRHLDRFRDNKSRAFSMIMYLNEDWQAGDGGELVIYHEDHAQRISPLGGKCVFFKSDELEHEVLLNHKPRMSITGWLRRN